MSDTEFVDAAIKQQHKLHECQARIRALEALVQSIDQIIDAKSEMFTLDTDVLENIKDRIRAAQTERQQGE